jgi:CO/xanthine dehydrogenase FAD-binding subunit
MKNLEDVPCEFPDSLSAALAVLEDQACRPLAGGTDLMVQWASDVLPVPDRVVSVLAIPELQGIREEEDTVIIGAAATHAMIRRSPLVCEYLPALAASAATIGGNQIQMRGTIGGNVANASPAGDLAPALAITDGSVLVAGLEGEREVPLSGFFLGYRKIDLKPGELIVEFRLPKKREQCIECFRKLGPRAAQAISKVMGACRLHIEDGSVSYFAVALGSVGPTVVRLPELEAWIKGRTLDAETLAEAEQRASAEVQPIDDIRSTAVYRKWVSGRIVRGFLRQAGE